MSEPSSRTYTRLMTGPVRIAAFLVVLVGVFAAATAAGGAIDPSGPSEEPAEGAHGEGADAMAPPGLQVAEDGYRLMVEAPRLVSGAAGAPFEFRIVEDGETVRDFEVEHEKEMHFIVVRRDMGGFQHLHPSMAPDGTWSTPVDFSTGGVYRVFADFKLDGAKRTLGADVQVGGSFQPDPLPAPRATAKTDGGLDVTLRSEDAAAGAETRVEFEVRDGGELVNDRLQPYLEAKGHLVALRAGDLAYLHTHPDDDELAFESEYPSAGAYRLFVQFRYRGELHTAAFTQEVGR